MIIEVNGYCFFSKKKIGSINKIHRYFGIKRGTYAGRTISRLYYEYFGCAYRIDKYYRKYYRKEFPSCEEFLVCRYNLPLDLAKTIVQGKLWCTDMGIKRDQISYSFSYDDELTKLFSDYVGGIQHENSSWICYK